MESLKRLEPVGLLLLILGALNWAVIALFNDNVLADALGNGTVRDVGYCVVGFAALMFVPRLFEELRLEDRMHIGRPIHPRGT
jgi:uncharacterized membrane protein YuzA (DUF378 family)